MAELPAPAEEKATAGLVLEEPELNEEYASGIRLATLVGSLMFGMFLVALDNVSSFGATVP
jgi:hypothetical protein